MKFLINFCLIVSNLSVLRSGSWKNPLLELMNFILSYMCISIIIVFHTEMSNSSRSSETDYFLRSIFNIKWFFLVFLILQSVLEHAYNIELFLIIYFPKRKRQVKLLIKLHTVLGYKKPYFYCHVYHYIVSYLTKFTY